MDDEALARRTIGRMLRTAGYHPVEARSANDALTVMGRKATPDLMLLDLHMPGESGIDFLKGLGRPLPIPVIVLSGSAEIGKAVLAIQLGASEFLEKSAPKAELLGAIEKTLASSQLRREWLLLAQEDALRETTRSVGNKTYREILDESERTLLRAALQRTHGNVAAAARLLGVDRAHIHRRVMALEILDERL